MKRKLSIIIVSLLSLILIGCNNLVERSTEEATGLVLETSHVESSITQDVVPASVGDPLGLTKMPVVIKTDILPDEYNIMVEYKGAMYKFDDKLAYDKYKAGDKVPLIVEVSKYEDGTIRYKVNLKGVVE